MQFEAFFGIRRSDRGNIRASESGVGSPTVLTVNDNAWQVFNLSAARSVNLPTTSVKIGDRVLLENTGQFDLTVNASNATELTVANGCNMEGSIRGGRVYLEALQDTPTTPAHWRVIDVYERQVYTGITVAVASGAGSLTGSTGLATLLRVNHVVTLYFRWSATVVGGVNAVISSAFVPTRCRIPTTMDILCGSQQSGTASGFVQMEPRNNGTVFMGNATYTNLATFTAFNTGINGTSGQCTYDIAAN